MKFLKSNWLVDDHEALVVFAAAIVPATPVVILAPFVFATPVLVFTPFLARSNGPVNIGHVKTGLARNDGCLKAFPERLLKIGRTPELNPSLVSPKPSPSIHQRFWRPNTGYECCEQHPTGHS